MSGAQAVMAIRQHPARALAWAVPAVLVVWLLWHLSAWAVWDAVFVGDLGTCQAMGHRGACWRVVAEKIRPLMLGGYPHEAQWRPALALCLVSLCAGVGLCALWRVAGFRLHAKGAWGLCLLGVLPAGLLMRGGVWGLPLVPADQWGGLPLTLALTLTALALSAPLAVLLALGRRSPHAWLSWPCTVFIEGVRGVPLITLLFMAAFMLPALLPDGASWSLFGRASVALTCFSAAYLAELLRAGLQSVPKEQVEAAQTLGMPHWRIQQRVVLPQAVRAVLPALVGHVIGVLKESSLVMVISLHELTGSLGMALGGDADWRPYYLEGYLFIAAIYALLCWTLSRVGRRMERLSQARSF